MQKQKLRLILIVALVVAGFSMAVLAFGSKKPQQTVADTSTQEHPDGHVHSQQTASLEDLTSQAQVSMDIKGFVYTKPAIKIKKGTTVTWTNQDTIQHNVMKEHDHSEHAHSAPDPDQIKPDVFAGPLLRKGQSYSFTFNEIGAFPYHCAPHPDMVGTVEVVE